jgi:hypothetical protein
MLFCKNFHKLAFRRPNSLTPLYDIHSLLNDNIGLRDGAWKKHHGAPAYYVKVFQWFWLWSLKPNMSDVYSSHPSFSCQSSTVEILAFQAMVREPEVEPMPEMNWTMSASLDLN